MLALLLTPLVAKADPPVLTTLAPRSVALGQRVELTLTGDRLTEVSGALCRIANIPGALAPAEDPNVKVEVLATDAKKTRLRLTATAQAEPGLRELRLVTPGGVSNARPFLIGAYPETTEAKPSGSPAAPQRLSTLPVTVLGRIQPADETDRYLLTAQAGQQLVIDVDAVALEATLDSLVTLRDAGGRILATNDDADGRDSRLAYRCEKAGDYVVEIRDTSYRAGADAFYRLTVGAVATVTGIFPLGAKRSTLATIGVEGLNLPSATMAFPVPSDAALGLRELRVETGEAGVVRHPFVISDQFEFTETEPNDDRNRANEVNVPVVINGRADRPGDIDSYRFLAQGRSRLVFEVFAQRLGSPYDPYLSIADSTGKELGNNDDSPDSRDSYREVNFPLTTEYVVRIRSLMSDQAGASCAYRLVIRPPTPDFELPRNLEPLTVKRGTTVELPVSVTRQDGWQGPVNLSLLTPTELFGVRATVVTVPGSAKEGRLRITAAPNASLGHFANVLIRGEGTPANLAIAKDRPLLLTVAEN